MQHDHNGDDSSHYEISLTAGQAFIAFVLLLLSLAAAFAFGVIVGKGQIDGALAAAAAEDSGPRPVAQEARIVDAAAEFPSERREATRSVPAPVIVEERLASASTTSRPPGPPSVVLQAPPAPHFAQLLSTADAKAAEALAARLIEAGFLSAYVERGNSPRGLVHRVRVGFPSEADARMSLEKLKNFSSGDVWIAAATPPAP